MREIEKNHPTNQLAMRAGAASIYLIVGLLVGIIVAVVAQSAKEGEESASFAAVTFGVAAFSALLAASFPSAALGSLAPLANFIWGVISGSLTPESLTKSPQDASALSRWLFWLGFATGCAALFAWLTT